MVDQLGSKKYAMPFIAVLLVGAVMALMFYPMLHVSPKELPFAVLSLDEGATTPQGEVNAGELMVDQLVAGAPTDGEQAPIKWSAVASQADLDEALADGDYFGALVIPADFTQSQMLAQAGAGENPQVEVVLDNAKSPVVAAQMQPVLGGMFQQLGLQADLVTINEGPELPSSSPLAGMMSQQLSVMPLMIMSLVSSILLTRIFPKAGGRTAKERFVILGKQLLSAAGVSFVVSLVVMWLLNGVLGAGAPFWTMAIFLWFASFMVMTLFLGAFDVSIYLGGLLVVGIIFTGTMTAVLPPELLPTFWANWIAPWVPQPQVASGVRDILYMGSGLMPWGTPGLLVTGLVGLALLVAAAYVPGKAPAAAPLPSAA